MEKIEKGFSFTVLADAGALPEGAIDAIHAEVLKGLRKYLDAVKRGEYLQDGNFIPVDDLLQTKYDPKVRPFLPRRKPH